NEIVAVLGPMPARQFVANVMPHARGTRRENRHIAAAFPLQFELRALQTFANLIVGNFQIAFGWNMSGILQSGNLAISVRLQFLWRCGVLSVAVDDHIGSSCFTWNANHY